MTNSPERRITCPRHHWLFSVTPQGITIKCRAGECRMVYVVSWEELETKRQEMLKAPLSLDINCSYTV